MYRRYIKRMLSLLFALIALPFVLLVAVLIKPLIYFEDKGPLIYVSKRAGKDAKTFKMYKFRSMKVNSPMLLNADGSTYNSEHDDRQTRIGKILRKTSIDELPQVINILKGDMAWIGPRPVLDSQVLTFTEEEKEKFRVLPGLTGYTQAYSRNQLTSHDERMMDAWYANHVSFLLDVKILIKTIDTVFHPERVYKNHD